MAIPLLINVFWEWIRNQILGVKLGAKGQSQYMRLPDVRWNRFHIWFNQNPHNSIPAQFHEYSEQLEIGPGCDEYSDIQIFSDTNIHLYHIRIIFLIFGYPFICFLIRIYSDIRSYYFLIQICSRKNLICAPKSPK